MQMKIITIQRAYFYLLSFFYFSSMVNTDVIIKNNEFSLMIVEMFE